MEETQIELIKKKSKTKEKPKAVNAHERRVRRKIEDWNAQRQLEKEWEL